MGVDQANKPDHAPCYRWRTGGKLPYRDVTLLFPFLINLYLGQADPEEIKLATTRTHYLSISVQRLFLGSVYDISARLECDADGAPTIQSSILKDRPPDAVSIRIYLQFDVLYILWVHGREWRKERVTEVCVAMSDS
jgi:hypothetical protein